MARTKKIEKTTDTKARKRRRAPSVAAIALPQACTAEQWRNRSLGVHMLNIPSGLCVHVRMPDWGRLLFDGVVTDKDLLNTQNARKNRESVLALARTIAPYVVVSPPVSKAARPGAITVAEMFTGDLLTILYWAINPQVSEEGAVARLEK